MAEQLTVDQLVGGSSPSSPTKVIKYIYKINNMKIRTWEKAYWGIITALLVISLITIVLNKGDIPANVFGETKLISKSEAALYTILAYLIVGGIIWFIVRLFVGGEDDKGKRERERER